MAEYLFSTFNLVKINCKNKIALVLKTLPLLQSFLFSNIGAQRGDGYV